MHRVTAPVSADHDIKQAGLNPEKHPDCTRCNMVADGLNPEEHCVCTLTASNCECHICQCDKHNKTKTDVTSIAGQKAIGAAVDAVVKSINWDDDPAEPPTPESKQLTSPKPPDAPLRISKRRRTILIACTPRVCSRSNAVPAKVPTMTKRNKFISGSATQ